MPNPLTFEKKMRKRGWWLCWAGWGIFALSLPLPAVYGWSDWLPGWECFRDVCLATWDLIVKHNSVTGRDLYYTSFVIPNLSIVASPIILGYFRRDLRYLRRFALLTAI